MNSHELRNLQEAYIGIYDNNLNEESKLGYLGKQKRKYNNEKNASDKYTGVKMPSDVNHTTNQVKAAFRAHRKNKNLSGNDLHKIASASESFDLYDIILSHLLDEGYADTEQAAEAIMANMGQEWREDILDEGLGGAKNEKDETRKTDRQTRLNASVGLPPEGLSSAGMRERIKKNQEERQREKQGKEFLEKHPRKKSTQQEQVDLYDIILSHLLDEGYADTEESATAIMVNMSEEWKENIMERDVERGEEDDSRAVRAHNKSLKGKDGKPLYPSGRAGYARRPNPANDPRYGSQR